MTTNTSHTEHKSTFKILIVDLIGLKFLDGSTPDHREVAKYIEEKDGVFHLGSEARAQIHDDGRLHFFYLPHLSTAEEILAETERGQYDAVIAAATAIPADARFAEGGVRIGTGTGNMGSASWGGPNGEKGVAPLMNTPGINARATAQMVFKALLAVAPDLPVGTLHQRVVDGLFDTGRDLVQFPTEKLEGKRFAILGYGNIGQEVASLAKAFGMDVTVYARPRHRDSIIAKGYSYCESPVEAARGSDVISVHLGLGRLDASSKTFANAGLLNCEVLSALNDNSVLINYDRGELIDISALEKALSAGKIRHAAIDADIFLSAEGPTGPLVPYLSLLPEHGDRLALLPHAAADTDHPTRVAGAKQAVDQIIDAIRERRVANLKGDLPEGYTLASGRGVESVDDAKLMKTLRDVSATLIELVTALEAEDRPTERASLIEQHQLLIDRIVPKPS